MCIKWVDKIRIINSVICGKIDLHGVLLSRSG